MDQVKCRILVTMGVDRPVAEEGVVGLLEPDSLAMRRVGRGTLL